MDIITNNDIRCDSYIRKDELINLINGLRFECVKSLHMDLITGYLIENDPDPKDFKAIDNAIKYLKHYYPIKINDYKSKIEFLENKEKQNYLNNEMLQDLLNDYRRIYQIIYKLIENKED